VIARILVVLMLSFASIAQTTPPAGSVQSFVISGTALDAVTGQPIPEATVSIYSSENAEFTRRTTTSTDGRFTFSSVPAGKYTLTGTAYGYRAQGYHQHGDYFVGIAVGAGLDSEKISFRLTQDARIEGTITDDDNEPVRNANVQVFQRMHDNGRQETPLFIGGATDDRGHYVIGHLAPGTYFVAVSARPWYAQYFTHNDPAPDPENSGRVAGEREQMDVAYPYTFYPSALDSTGATPIVLRPGNHAAADITLRAMPSVHLRVKSKAGLDTKGGDQSFNPFPAVSQRVFEGALAVSTSSQGSCIGNQSCEFTGIAPGHYMIEMQNPGGKGGRGWFKEMDLSGTVELDAAENPPLASVSGDIKFVGARPSGRLDILLFNRLTNQVSAAEISSKGTFAFDDILPGTYDVTLNIGQGIQISDIKASGARMAGLAITVTGGPVQLAVVATRALARISGTVVRSEVPIPGAMVVLVPRDPVQDLPLFRRDESDSDGTFLLRDVLPGTYSVIAIENGWDLDWANPATLQTYLKNGVAVDISGETRLSIKVPLQP
jgi:protocatechuate 3,4-dioxygenase beta subunit